jgi:hypothetical protein
VINRLQLSSVRPIAAPAAGIGGSTPRIDLRNDPDFTPEIKNFAKSGHCHELAATNAAACRNSVASPPRSKAHLVASEIG